MHFHESGVEASVKLLKSQVKISLDFDELIRLHPSDGIIIVSEFSTISDST